MPCRAARGAFYQDQDGRILALPPNTARGCESRSADWSRRGGTVSPNGPATAGARLGLRQSFGNFQVSQIINLRHSRVPLCARGAVFGCGCTSDRVFSKRNPIANRKSKIKNGQVAVRPGLEPGITPPKGAVLPLHHRTSRTKVALAEASRKTKVWECSRPGRSDITQCEFFQKWIQSRIGKLSASAITEFPLPEGVG